MGAGRGGVDCTPLSLYNPGANRPMTLQSVFDPGVLLNLLISKQKLTIPHAALVSVALNQLDMAKLFIASNCKCWP